MQPDDEDDVPDDLACPITFSLMTDPVVCVEDGRVYECAALVRCWRDPNPNSKPEPDP